MFYVYLIENIKVGCTSDVYNRVIKQQGQNKCKILFRSPNIHIAAKKEIYYQKKYNFKLDNQKFNQMVHITNYTITFKKSNKNNFILESIPNIMEIGNDVYSINNDLKNWILNNNYKSQFSEERFIYKDAFLKEYSALNKSYNLDFNKIREWAKNKGIIEKGDVKTQLLKLNEEVGELAQSILKKDKAEFIDAIGDIVVVLTNLSELGNKFFGLEEKNICIEDCIEAAYNVIKDRQGIMYNGTFEKKI